MNDCMERQPGALFDLVAVGDQVCEMSAAFKIGMNHNRSVALVKLLMMLEHGDRLDQNYSPQSPSVFTVVTSLFFILI